MTSQCSTGQAGIKLSSLQQLIDVYEDAQMGVPGPLTEAVPASISNGDDGADAAAAAGAGAQNGFAVHPSNGFAEAPISSSGAGSALVASATHQYAGPTNPYGMPSSGDGIGGMASAGGSANPISAANPFAASASGGHNPFTAIAASAPSSSASFPSPSLATAAATATGSSRANPFGGGGVPAAAPRPYQPFVQEPPQQLQEAALAATLGLGVRPSPTPGGGGDGGGSTWSCTACTFVNYGLLQECEMCGAQRSANATSASTSGGSGGGSVGGARSGAVQPPAASASGRVNPFASMAANGPASNRQARVDNGGGGGGGGGGGSYGVPGPAQNLQPRLSGGGGGGGGSGGGVQSNRERLLCEGSLVKVRGTMQNRNRWFMLTTKKLM